MSEPTAAEVLAALREFVSRVDEYEPDAPVVVELAVEHGDERERVSLRAPVARALMQAMRGYHDPRDRGRCTHCGGRRLDDNFLCRDCGRPNGVFGQLLAERVARHTEPPAVASRAAAGRHARTED